MAVELNHYAPEDASVKLQDCFVVLSASAVATVNTNTSPLMHIFHQYNIFMKILSTILKDRKDTSKLARNFLHF